MRQYEIRTNSRPAGLPDVSEPVGRELFFHRELGISWDFPSEMDEIQGAESRASIANRRPTFDRGTASSRLSVERRSARGYCSEGSTTFRIGVRDFK